jgi:hypothetical protein
MTNSVVINKKRHPHIDNYLLYICRKKTNMYAGNIAPPNFGQLSDPRIDRNGNENLSFLKRILQLPNSEPSQDTINRVFEIINPCHFERLFTQWTNEPKISDVLEKVIAIDGKTVRVHINCRYIWYMRGA